MVKPLKEVLTWNAGHLGQQQWAELRTWLRTASDQYDVIALQETHWQESTEFDVEGWHCISSASKGKAKAPKAKSKPTSDHNSSEQPGTQPQEERVHDDKRADGVMILTAPHIPKATIRWSEHHKGRVLEVVFQWKGARVHIVSVYQHVWTTSKTAQHNREDRSKCLCLGFWGLEGEWMGCEDGGDGVMISHASNMCFKSCVQILLSRHLSPCWHVQNICRRFVRVKSFHGSGALLESTGLRVHPGRKP